MDYQNKNFLRKIIPFVLDKAISSHSPFQGTEYLRYALLAELVNRKITDKSSFLELASSLLGKMYDPKYPLLTTNNSSQTKEKIISLAILFGFVLENGKFLLIGQQPRSWSRLVEVLPKDFQLPLSEDRIEFIIRKRY